MGATHFESLAVCVGGRGQHPSTRAVNRSLRRPSGRAPLPWGHGHGQPARRPARWSVAHGPARGNRGHQRQLLVAWRGDDPLRPAEHGRMHRRHRRRLRLQFHPVRRQIRPRQFRHGDGQWGCPLLRRSTSMARLAVRGIRTPPRSEPCFRSTSRRRWRGQRMFPLPFPVAPVGSAIRGIPASTQCLRTARVPRTLSCHARHGRWFGPAAREKALTRPRTCS